MNLEKALLRRFPDAKGKYPEYKVCCPECHENRYRLGINLNKNVAHCFNCGIRLGVKALSKLLNYNSKAEFEPTTISSLESSVESLTEQKYNDIQLQNILIPGIPITEVSETKYWTALKSEVKDILDYLESRKFCLSIINDYKLMVAIPNSRLSGRLILPVVENGRLVYFQARALYGQTPKYLNPSKLQAPIGKSNFVFNLEQAAQFKNIIICEGIFSAIATGKNAVAIFGKELSLVQSYKIMASGATSATILFDAGVDESFKAVKAAKMLSTRLKIRVAKLPYGDPNEVTGSVLDDVLTSAEPYENLFFS